MMAANINVPRAATIAPTAIPAMAPMDNPVDDPAAEPVAKLLLLGRLFCVEELADEIEELAAVEELAAGVETAAPSRNNESCDCDDGLHAAGIKEEHTFWQGSWYRQHPKNGGSVPLHVNHLVLSASMQSFPVKAL